MKSAKDPGKIDRAVDSIFSTPKPAPRIEPGDTFRPKPKIEPGDTFNPGITPKPKN